MTDYNIYRSTDALRRAATMGDRALGTTTDTEELFLPSDDTVLGRPAVFPQLPQQGQDVRRMWCVSSQGQGDTWTDAAGVKQDAAGIVLTPRAAATTDPVARGIVQAYELADGGLIQIESYGTYKCGGASPHITARLKCGSEYWTPDYGLDTPLSPGFDVTSGVPANAWDWSYATLGTNALAGYEALSSLRTNTPPGQFSWRLTTTIRSLGRYAKHETYDEDVVDWATATGYSVGNVVRNADLARRTYICIHAHTSGTSTKPGTGATWTAEWREITGNVAVEMTLEWGALHYNPGQPFTFALPFSQNNPQYSVFWDTTGTAGVKRGCVYSFLGEQWLCHAGSTSNATTGSKGSWTTTRNTVIDMLAEQAPGIGAYWKEFFVPLVSRKTYTAYGYMDHTRLNEITLELGGPTYIGTGTSISAYSSTTTYTAESSIVSDTDDYVAKVSMDYNATAANSLYVHMDGGSEVSLMRAAPTASLSGSISGSRFWRKLADDPEDRYDVMRLLSTQAYLYGGRVGAAQVRTR